MMHHGSLGHGSSSSMSPLAQATTVEPNPPPGNVFDDRYDYSLRPSLDNWLHLHPPNSVSDTFMNPNWGNSISQVPDAEGSILWGEPVGVWRGKCVDSVPRKVHVEPKGIEQLNAKFSTISEEKASVQLFNMHGASFVAPTSVLKEMSCPQVSEPISLMNVWNPFNPNPAPYDFHLAQLDTCTTNPMVFYPSVAYSSPAQAFGSPGNRTSSLQKATMPKDENSSNRLVDTYNNNGSGDHLSANVKDPSFQINCKGKEGCADTSMMSNCWKKYDHSSLDSPLIKRDFPSRQRPVVDNLNISNAGTFASRADGSVESSLDPFDHFNTTIDSPCWKGALPSPYYPIGFSKAVVPPIAQKLEVSNDLSTRGQIRLSNDGEEESVTSPETGYVEDSSSLQWMPTSVSNGLPSAEHKFIDANKTGSDCSNVDSENGTAFYVGIQEPRSDYMLLKKLTTASELKTCDVMPSNQEALQPVSKDRIADPLTHTDGAAQDVLSDFISHSRKYAVNLFSSRVGSDNDITEPLGESDISSMCPLRRMDAPVLVKTIQYLSELLMSSCYGNANALNKRDYKILQLVIDNLDTCILKKVESMTPMPDTCPQLGSSYHLSKFTYPSKATTTGRSQVTVTKADDILGQSTLARGEKMHSSACNKKLEKLNDFVSLSADTNSEDNNDTAQAVKKVLEENFSEQGGECHQTQLYKNLWIEAEAALCSMKYEVQLSRMKIEMEKKYKQCQGKGKDFCSSSHAVGKPKNVEELSSLNAVHGLDMDEALTPKSKESFTENIATLGENVKQSSYQERQETYYSSLDDEAEDVEASVMARFKVLKSRVDNLSSKSKLPDSTNIGTNEGMQETMYSPCSLENNFHVGSKHQPIKIVDLGIADRKSTWPFIRNGLEEKTFGHENMSDMQKLGLGEFGLDSDLSEECEMDREFQVCIVNEPVNESHMANGLEGKSVAGGSDSTSSDWEHVLTEELTW